MKKNRWVGALLTLCLLLGTLLTGCGRDKEYQYNFDNGCIKAQYDESYWEYMDAGKSGDYYELLFYEKGLDEEDTYEEGNLVVVRYSDRRSVDEEDYVDETKADERDDGYTVSRESHRSGSVNGASTSTYKYRLNGSVERTIIFHSDEAGGLIIDVWMGAPDRAVGDEDLVNSIRKYGPLSDYEWSFGGQTAPGGNSSSGSNSQSSGSESSAQKPAEEFVHLSSIPIEVEDKSVNVYCLKDEVPSIKVDGRYITSEANGVSLFTFTFYRTGPLESVPKTEVSLYARAEFEVMQELTSLYSDVSLGTLVTGSGWAAQQVRCNLVDEDGKKYPGFFIYKVEQIGEYSFLYNEIEIDTRMANVDTRPTIEEICRALGLHFDFGD